MMKLMIQIKRIKIYKTITAESVNASSNEDNSNRLKGFYNPVTNSDGNTGGNTTDSIELLSNLDTDALTDSNVKETDFSPPSNIDDYYNGWKITFNYTGTVETKYIIKYFGDTNIAILDGTVNKPTNKVCVSIHINENN